MRIKQLQKQLKINKIDLALFWCDGEKKNTNIEYFSNYSGIGYLIVTKSNSFLLIPEYKQDKTKNSTVKFFIAEKKKYLIDQLAQKISKLKIKIFAFLLNALLGDFAIIMGTIKLDKFVIGIC